MLKRQTMARYVRSLDRGWIHPSTALLVDGEAAEVVGNWQVLAFTNPDDAVRRQDGKFGARNLRIDGDLPGETFTLDRSIEW